MSTLTLQINSLEALERLIGGDTETELAIRDNIANAFAGKYLKPLAKEILENIIDELMAPARDELERQMKPFFTTEAIGGWGNNKTVLSLHHKRIIGEKAKEVFDHEVSTILSQTVSDSEGVIKAKMSAAIAQIDAYLEYAMSEQRFNKLVNDAAQAKINEFLLKAR